MTQLTITINLSDRAEAMQLLASIHDMLPGDLTLRRSGVFDITDSERGVRLASGMIDTNKQFFNDETEI